jgi:hypothetical protein
VPTCEDCHPEHARLGRETVLDRGVVATCVSCHDDPGLQAEYAIPGGRLASYLGSYHGAATELGDSRTADCASCHGVHDVLPSDDFRSRVNRENLPRTCGGCHPNAGEHFAEGKIHLQPTLTQDRIVFFVRTGYLLFIVALMSAFLGYIGLDLAARVRKRLGPGRPSREEAGTEPEF